MDLFNKATQIAQNVSENVVNSAKTVSYKLNASPEQRELAGLKIQLDSVTKKLDTYYTEIGKRYIEYVNGGSLEAFDVEDIIAKMNPELELIAELEEKIQNKQQEIKDNELELAKQKAQDEFKKEKDKLETALTLDIITVDEYTEKLETAQKKLDNFDILRKLELQYRMQIITKDEYEEKVNAILKK